jgi:chemotaxis receptor (MCP) glutamine deamidase CheD
MNHFLLPDGESEHSAPSCYGIHAMELLINEILKLGGDRKRLQAKIFGGAQIHVMSHASLNIGRRNVEFVREFLRDEGIQIIGERVGGSLGVKVCFHTHTGRAFAKDVGSSGLKTVLVSEQRQKNSITEKLAPRTEEQLTLF